MRLLSDDEILNLDDETTFNISYDLTQDENPHMKAKLFVTCLNEHTIKVGVPYETKESPNQFSTYELTDVVINPETSGELDITVSINQENYEIQWIRIDDLVNETYDVYKIDKDKKATVKQFDCYYHYKAEGHGSLYY